MTINALAEAQRRTEERLEETVQALAEAQRQMGNRLTDTEEVLWVLAEKKGIRILHRPTPIGMDGSWTWPRRWRCPRGNVTGCG
ncbi:MAG: hypothetical protein RML46_08560 [Anaerolineae bacterium]|nr:hypothetical protein [Anaerolineae bacterium]MDW8068949.1 hypothetical protein [Anaerolineae bacterium]